MLKRAKSSSHEFCHRTTKERQERREDKKLAVQIGVSCATIVKLVIGGANGVGLAPNLVSLFHTCIALICMVGLKIWLVKP